MATAASNTVLLFKEIRAVNSSSENIQLYANISRYITLCNLYMGHMVTLVTICS